MDKFVNKPHKTFRDFIRTKRQKKSRTCSNGVQKANES